MASHLQNKKRRYNRDDDEGREKTPEEPVEDPLKDAATLYVGNLWVGAAPSNSGHEADTASAGPSIQQRNRFMSYSQNAERSSG